MVLPLRPSSAAFASSRAAGIAGAMPTKRTCMGIYRGSDHQDRPVERGGQRHRPQMISIPPKAIS